MLVDFFIGYANLSLMIAIVLNYEKGYLKFKMQQWKSKCNKRKVKRNSEEVKAIHRKPEIRDFYGLPCMFL